MCFMKRSNNRSKLVIMFICNPHLSEQKILVEESMILHRPLSHLSTIANLYKQNKTQQNYFSGFLSHISPESTAFTTIDFLCFSYYLKSQVWFKQQLQIKTELENRRDSKGFVLACCIWGWFVCFFHRWLQL